MNNLLKTKHNDNIITAYNPVISCRKLDRISQANLIDRDYDLRDLLESIGLPKKYRKDITAAIVIIGDGDYIAMWLSESGRYYELNSWYYALPYYRPTYWCKRNLPIYWLESNEYYQVKE